MLAGDVEANGLLENVSKLWCIVSQDIETSEFFVFHDYPEYDNAEVFDPADSTTHIIPKRNGSFIDGVRFWYLAAHNNSKLIVHNCLSYDKPLLERFYPKFQTHTDAWIDTLTQSRVQWYDRPTPKGCKSQHGLESYGIRFGVHKPAVKDWTFIDAFKIHRCIEDVKIQTLTYKYLVKEQEGILNDLGIDFRTPMVIEREYRVNATHQELHGAMVNAEHIDKCIVDLDGKIETLQSHIEPLLPPTVKTKSPKIGRKELGKLLGYTQNVPDKVNSVLVNGSWENVVAKEYHKPTTKFTRVEKSNVYSGFHMSCGGSPDFNKKKELTDWIKSNYPDYPPKEWDIEKEEKEVELLNKATCLYFECEPTDTNLIIGAHTKVSFIPSTMTQTEVVKSYLIKLGWREAEEWNEKKDSEGNKVRVEEDTWVYYPKKAAPEFQMRKLVKKREVMVTTPKLTDKDYSSLPEGVGQDIALYNTYMHRRRFFENPKDPENKGLKSYIRESGRIPCGLNNFSTSTGRSSHSVWVNAAGVGSIYGEETRATIIAEKGNKLVGADMKSAQLSIAAFFAKNATYYNAVASGQEVVMEADGSERYVGESAHCFSARNFGLVTQEEWDRAVATQAKDLLHKISLMRKKSKGASFGVIFGCAGKLLAKMLGVPEDKGNERKDFFLEQMGLSGVLDWLAANKGKYSYKGGYFIPLPFGYWCYCKSDHKAINYIIQGTEAVCQKIATNYFEEHARKDPELGTIVMSYQDELLVECEEEHAHKAGKILSEAYKYASDECFKWYLENPSLFPNKGVPDFAFDLDGGYKVGDNYLEVH